MQNKYFFSKQMVLFKTMFIFSKHFALSSKQITLFSKEMFHFKRNVSFQKKCFISKQMFHFKTNVSFQNKCFISKQMFHFKTNVSLQNKWFFSKQMFLFKTNVSFRHFLSLVLYDVPTSQSFILRLIRRAANHLRFPRGKKMANVKKFCSSCGQKYESRSTVKFCSHLTDSIIELADKGGAIVIWPKKDYLLEAHRQLDNTNFYTKIPQNNIPHLHTEIQSFLDDLKLQQTIDKQTHTFLSPHQPPRTPLFYMNPKIHKPNTPGRPIISGCDSPTEKLSIYIDHFLKPIVPLIPSYIKDTTHFLNTLFAIPTPLPPNTILATLDVTSLYTNIPHAEGIASATEALYNKHTEITHTASPPPKHIFRSILTYILKHNYFEFNSNFYLQTHGTAMGTRTAPSYANIFMADLENKLLDNSPNNLQPLIWKRYIDDIFVVWTHGEESLHTFINHLNTSHPTIKI